MHVCINSPHVSDKVSIYEKFGFGNDDNPQDDCVAKWYKWDERNSIAKDVEELVIALAGESKANSFISDDAYNEISSRKLEQMREEEKRKKRRYSWIGYGIGFAISIIPILILCIRENKKQKDFEQYKRQIMQEERVITNANGYEYVDLGLSVKWATCNVGATSPEDYGNYYAWGETMTKSNYDNSVTNGKKMSKISGKTQYDAARANWGGTWRLPTDAELEELKNKCTWTLTIQNGIKGYNITGINGNSIFLPAAGYRSESSLNGDGDFGHYWSSTPTFNYEHYAYALTFYDREKRVYWEGNNRGKGYSIRPVTN